MAEKGKVDVKPKYPTGFYPDTQNIFTTDLATIKTTRDNNPDAKNIQQAYGNIASSDLPHPDRNTDPRSPRASFSKAQPLTEQKQENDCCKCDCWTGLKARLGF